MDVGYLFLCLGIIGIWLAAWGAGSLMVVIGKIRGWNTKKTFWVSAIVYALLIIVPYLIGWYANDMLHVYFLNTPVYILNIVLIISGIVFAPLINLIVKRQHPDVFKQSTSSNVAPNSKAQIGINKETAVQRQQAASLGNNLQPHFEPTTPPVINPKAASSSRNIFVSYRRSDSADIAGRIYDRLVGRFGKALIFKDVDSIPLGVDFKEHLDLKVGECSVLLAIIGDQWLDTSDAHGNRRLNDPADFVRIEIESALARNIPVIPLLVRGAKMPTEESLPDGLRKLHYRNGIAIRPDPDFHRDMDRLINALEKYIP